MFIYEIVGNIPAQHISMFDGVTQFYKSACTPIVIQVCFYLKQKLRETSVAMMFVKVLSFVYSPNFEVRLKRLKFGL